MSVLFLWLFPYFTTISLILPFFYFGSWGNGVFEVNFKLRYTFIKGEDVMTLLMQYRRKEKEKYIGVYVDALKKAKHL